MRRYRPFLLILSLVQLAASLLLRGKMSPIISDPLLIQAILLMTLTMLFYSKFGQYKGIYFLKLATMIVPVVLISPYFSTLLYFMWYEQVLLAWMGIVSIVIAFYTNSTAP